MKCAALIMFVATSAWAENKAPKKRIATVFEPSADHLGTAPWPHLLGFLSEAGYVTVRTADLSPTDAPRVTVQAIADRAHAAGVLALAGVHGNASGPFLEQYRTEAARDAAFTTLIQRGFGEHIRKATHAGRYYIKVTSGFFSVATWLNLSSNRAVIALVSGQSVGWAQDVGGRVQFSYAGATDMQRAAADMRELLEPLTTARDEIYSARMAYTSGSYSRGYKMTSDGDTVLIGGNARHSGARLLQRQPARLEDWSDTATQVSSAEPSR